MRNQNIVNKATLSGLYIRVFELEVYFCCNSTFGNFYLKLIDSNELNRSFIPWKKNELNSRYQILTIKYKIPNTEIKLLNPKH